jgi:hypothetical protein
MQLREGVIYSISVLEMFMLRAAFRIGGNHKGRGEVVDELELIRPIQVTKYSV